MNPFTRSLYSDRTQIAMQAARQPNPAKQCPTGYFYDIGTGKCAQYPACEWQHMQTGSTYEEALQLCANCMNMFMDKFGISYAEARKLCSAGKPAPTGPPAPKQGHTQAPAPKQGHLRPRQPGSSSQAAPGTLQTQRPGPAGQHDAANFCTDAGYVWDPKQHKCVPFAPQGPDGLQAPRHVGPPPRPSPIPVRVANRAYRYL